MGSPHRSRRADSRGGLCAVRGQACRKEPDRPFVADERAERAAASRALSTPAARHWPEGGRQMKRSIGLTLGVAAMSLVTSTAFAGVNCNQVKKYLGTGRSVQDVAETMVISLDDVKKCQEGGDAAAAGAAPAAPAAAAGAAA